MVEWLVAHKAGVLAAGLVALAALATVGDASARAPASRTAVLRSSAVSWKGTLDGHGVVAGYQTCSGDWKGTIQLDVAGSTVNGSGSVDIGSPACSQTLGTLPDVNHADFTITGTKESTSSGQTQFRLFLHPKAVLPSGPVYDPSGFLVHFGQSGEGIQLVLTANGNRIDQELTTTVPLSGGATVTLDDHFVLKSICDPDLLAKALREFDTANGFAKAGVDELNKAADDLRDFRNEYAKEFVEIGGEKLTILKGVEAISHTAFEALEVTASYVGIGVTIEELYTKIVPAIRDAGKLSAEAQQDFKRAEQWAARGNADLEQALAQGPCVDEVEGRLNKLLDDQKLQDQAHKLIDSWQNNGYLYVNPTTGDVLDEGAALKAAKAAIQGKGRSTQSAAAPPRKVYATAAQLRAALAALNRAIALHGKANGQSLKLQTASDTLRKRLGKLIP